MTNAERIAAAMIKIQEAQEFLLDLEFDFPDTIGDISDLEEVISSLHWTKQKAEKSS